jgi:hypothetical protein
VSDGNAKHGSAKRAVNHLPDNSVEVGEVGLTPTTRDTTNRVIVLGSDRPKTLPVQTPMKSTHQAVVDQVADVDPMHQKPIPARERRLMKMVGMRQECLLDLHDRGDQNQKMVVQAMMMVRQTQRQPHHLGDRGDRDHRATKRRDRDPVNENLRAFLLLKEER